MMQRIAIQERKTNYILKMAWSDVLSIPLYLNLEEYIVMQHL